MEEEKLGIGGCFCAAVILWILISFFDISCHNLPTEEPYEYGDWNFFVVFTEVADFIYEQKEMD